MISSLTLLKNWDDPDGTESNKVYKILMNILFFCIFVSNKMPGPRGFARQPKIQLQRSITWLHLILLQNYCCYNKAFLNQPAKRNQHKWRTYIEIKLLFFLSQCRTVNIGNVNLGVKERLVNTGIDRVLHSISSDWHCAVRWTRTRRCWLLYSFSSCLVILQMVAVFFPIAVNTTNTCSSDSSV